MRVRRRARWCLPVSIGLLVVLGCGSNPVGMRYRAERDMWKARQLERRLRVRPVGSWTREEIEPVLRAYHDLLARYPMPSAAAGRDSTMVRDIGRIRFQAQMGTVTPVQGLPDVLGYVRLLRQAGDTAQVRQVLSQVRRDYTWDMGLSLRASQESINEMRSRGDLGSVVRLYQDLAGAFPARGPGGRPLIPVLEAPVLAAATLAEMGRAGQANAELDKAEAFYRGVIATNPGDATAATAWVELGMAATQRGRFDDAATDLNSALRCPGSDELKPRILYLQGILQQEDRHDLDAAAAAFAEVADRYPGDPAAADASLRQAACLAGERRYDDALGVLARMQDTFRQDRQSTARGRAMTARILAQSGRWTDALLAYRSLQTDYPKSQEALQAPLEIAEHYRQIGDEKAERDALDAALETYDGIARENMGTPVARMADAEAAQALLLMKRWAEAADKLLAMPSRYPGDPRNPLDMVQAAHLYEERLGDAEKAAQILEDVASTYPQSPVAAQARTEAGKLRGR